MKIEKESVRKSKKEEKERKKIGKFWREINKWKIIRMNVMGWRETSVAEIMLIKFSSSSSERIEINERKVNEAREFCFFSLCVAISAHCLLFGWRDAYAKFMQTSINVGRQWWTARDQIEMASRSSVLVCRFFRTHFVSSKERERQRERKWQCMCICVNMFT